MVIKKSKSGKTFRKRWSSHLQAWFMANEFFQMRQTISAGTNCE